MQDRLFEIIFEKDEVTWQAMLYNLVKEEGMDPWDLDVSLLSKKYIDMLKKLKEVNFRVSGKVVLAAAILLKIKSTRLVKEEIGELDRLMAPAEEEESAESFYDDLEKAHEEHQEVPELIPRTPLPRKRKISIYDLVGALQKALEVKDRRFLKHPAPIKINLHERKVDITKLIADTYERLLAMSSGENKLTFSQILPSTSKMDKIYTFIPLLHLSNHDTLKINLVQNEPFGEIFIELRSPSEHVTAASRKEEVAAASISEDKSQS